MYTLKIPRQDNKHFSFQVKLHGAHFLSKHQEDYCLSVPRPQYSESAMKAYLLT